MQSYDDSELWSSEYITMAVGTNCVFLSIIGLVGSSFFAYTKIVDVQIVLPYDDIEEVNNCESCFSCRSFNGSILVN